MLGETMHETQETLHKTQQTPMRLFGAGPYAAPQGRHFPPHRDPAWELIYYRTGYIQSVVGELAYESRPGMMVIIPPATLHSETAWTAYANFWIQIEAPLDAPWPATLMDNADENFGQICQQIVREYSVNETDGAAMIHALLTQLDIRLRRSHRQRQLPKAESIVRHAEHLLQERYAAPLTIRSVAAELGISPTYLRSLFVQMRGSTPMAYLQSVRVHRALNLLRGTDLTLDMIAGFCGYDSASHLSRCVKRATGSSPGALRS